MVYMFQFFKIRQFHGCETSRSKVKVNSEMYRCVHKYVYVLCNVNLMRMPGVYSGMLYVKLYLYRLK
jgi:hypothetical protein